MSDSTIETTVYRFRTAVGGFHKGDVADYISKSAASHRAELEKYKTLLAEMEQENESLRQQLSELIASVQEPEEASPQLSEETSEAQNISEMELAAYRRAEAAERLANARAKKMYSSLEDICRDTDAEFASANAAVQETVETILAQAATLSGTCAKLSESLNASREKLTTMDAMIPDPAETLETEV